VHVTQADQTLATADRMNVDFFMNSGHASTEPSTQEASGSAVADSVASVTANLPEEPQASAATETATETPAEAPAEAAAPRPQHGAANLLLAATTSPSTQPEIPIIVRWTGKLIMTPPDADVPPLTFGDSVLQLIGDAAPAVLNRAGSVIHCASFRYHTLDQSVELNNSPASPIVTVVDANGTKVFAPAVAYAGRNHTATIAGPARAEFPVATSAAADGKSSGATQPTIRSTRIARADWSDSCTLILEPGERGDMQVSEALLDGDVHVDHPQVKLNADELDLGLDHTPRAGSRAPTTQAGDTMATSGQLRSMDASGAVDCTLHDSQGKPQRIMAEHLTLATKREADGTDTPSEVTADGAVHTFDVTQSLRAEHLVAELQPAATTVPPSTKPAGGDVQLRELTATQDVHFTATDGSFADADYLHIETIRPATASLPADQEMVLLGQPSARVGDKQNFLTGPVIHYNPGTKIANVIGAGTIHGIQEAAAADAAHSMPTSRPIDVAWEKSFALDGIGNHVDIKGDVHTRSTSGDGTVNSAIGDRVKVILVDAPPTTAPSTAPISAPSMLVKSGDTNFMKNKLVDTVTLLAKDNQNVEVSSIARDQAGAIIHAMNLYAKTAIYDRTHDKFIVPVPGRMLVRDFRNKGPTTAPASAPSESSAGGMRGTSAFEWEKSLVYDQHDDQAVMAGDVQVVHQAPGAASYQMYADKITVDLDPGAHPTTRATSGPSSRPVPGGVPGGEDTMKVKRLVAEGQVRMISQKLGFTAAEAVYDPVTQVITARGSLREPAQLLDEQGLSTGTFDKLVYNTSTDQVQITEFHGNMIK
jgi:lipopolysaccharide export system protein LptA